MSIDNDTKWNDIYDSCTSLLKQESVFDQLKFYNAKPFDFLDKIYVVAIERKDYKTAEIIFEILKERS